MEGEHQLTLYHENWKLLSTLSVLYRLMKKREI